MEMQELGRSPEQLSALVGYAAGTRVGPDGKVCYVYSDPRVSGAQGSRLSAVAETRGVRMVGYSPTSLPDCSIDQENVRVVPLTVLTEY